MSNDKRNERSLDSALNGNAADDETRPLVDTADHVKQALAVDVPPADRQRALFLSGVATRERRLFSPARILVPAFAIAVIVFGAFAGQSSLADRGPMRDALNAVGIGDSPNEEIDEQLFLAAAGLREAENALDSDPEEARDIAIKCIEWLGTARGLLDEVDGERAEERLDQIEDFEDDAIDILVDAAEEQEDRIEDSDRRDRGSDDSDDNSGPGSDDSGSDDSGNSGSGSDDSGGDDSSGSGSGDSGSDDSGSGDSGSGDSSGSGSDGSGSGSDDSSGSGSGGDD